MFAVVTIPAAFIITLEPISLEEIWNIHHLTSEVYMLSLVTFSIHDPLGAFMFQSLENDHIWSFSRQDLYSVGYRTSLKHRLFPTWVAHFPAPPYLCGGVGSAACSNVQESMRDDAYWGPHYISPESWEGLGAFWREDAMEKWMLLLVLPCGVTSHCSRNQSPLHVL